MSGSSEIVLGVTGSIAAYRACDLIRRFSEKQCPVTVIMTKEAEQFITPLTLGALSGRKVYRDLFAGDSDDWQMLHLSLTQRARALVIAPATANIIGKMANGIADDLLTCSVIASKIPIFVAPAMNTEMYHNKIVKENILRLEKSGVQFIYPIKGKLACGIIGEGHLAEVEDIVQAVFRSFKK